jgi:hypothetical protein
MKLIRSIVASPVALAFLLLAASFAQYAHSPAFARAERKIAWLGENGRSEHPSSSPTVLTAEEWNAYLNEGGVKLPEGLSNIRISSQPSLAHADADVDFDRLTANRVRNNPLLALFAGKHHVAVTALVAGVHGTGAVRIESFALDGVEVPRIALEYFADRFLHPKYGNAAALDSTFRLPARIDSVIFGTAQITISQR